MRRAEEFVYRAVEEGWLEIDRQGRIWRLGRQQTSRWGASTVVIPCQRKRAETANGNPYLQVRAMFDNVRGITSAHRLVWFHFCGRIPSYLTINHKDGNKQNNHPANLELATSAEQTQHAMKYLGFKPFANAVRVPSLGENNGAAKLTARVVGNIRHSAQTGTALAKIYGVSPATISRVRNRGGWEYV